ncbi:WXG100 family type VII secretion target [Prauserella oleivorans]|uniref:WXG100 family type VII secretion target n=1 Tax=Prauserella oleivorans TaxID=1478153 RepID=A0ABW5W322_9PSEU
MSGFTVDGEELRQYAGKLAGQKDTASQIAGLVDKADVGDKSWGVVGLFVKDEYTRMLADLKETFTSLQEGLQSGSDKFKAAADGYQQHEDAIKQLLDGMKIEIDNR